jgi:hypothetical protein
MVVDRGEVEGTKAEDNGRMLLEKGATFIKSGFRGIVAANAKMRGREISNIVLSRSGAKVGMAIESTNEDVLDLVSMWS